MESKRLLDSEEIRIYQRSDGTITISPRKPITVGEIIFMLIGYGFCGYMIYKIYEILMQITDAMIHMFPF